MRKQLWRWFVFFQVARMSRVQDAILPKLAVRVVWEYNFFNV